MFSQLSVAGNILNLSLHEFNCRQRTNILQTNCLENASLVPQASRKFLKNLRRSNFKTHPYLYLSYSFTLKTDMND